ncbi:MAG: hypothetical protein V7K35_28280 [Nostoc sp.]|uniref:hypothetical protein n=1 Tax=Nostoc sp. TaxID=1180 RepID=UPI002FFA00CC
MNKNVKFTLLPFIFTLHFPLLLKLLVLLTALRLRIVAAFAIIASIAQVIGAGVQIAEYINNQLESQSVHIIETNNPKLIQTKQLHTYTNPG